LNAGESCAAHRLAVLPAMLMLLGSPTAAAVAEPQPAEIVRDVAVQLARVIAARHAELEAEPALMHAIVDTYLRPHFDLRTAGRLILGEHWKAASPAQQERFIAAFYGFLVRSYATSLLEFRHDTLRLLPEQATAESDSARVHALFVSADGTPVRIDYYMRRTAHGWRVVDVIAEGVSYVRTYRADIGAEIREGGLEATIERLERVGAERGSRRRRTQP
jgi:phospholipid transport system substrate-binding protein